MAQKSYTVRYERQGLAGQNQMVITVYNATTADTVSITELAAITDLRYVGINNAAPAITSVASTAFTSRTFTIPSTPSIGPGGAFDLFVIGAAMDAS